MSVLRFCHSNKLTERGIARHVERIMSALRRLTPPRSKNNPSARTKISGIRLEGNRQVRLHRNYARPNALRWSFALLPNRASRSPAAAAICEASEGTRSIDLQQVAGSHVTPLHAERPHGGSTWTGEQHVLQLGEH